MEKTGITRLELHEYFQNGCIKVKDTISDETFHNTRYAYYEQESGHKSYHSIDFEEEFGFYRVRGHAEIFSGLLATEYAHPEYGLVIVENHHENYLVELRETGYIEKILRLCERNGYRSEIVGEKNFVCIWKKMKK